MARSTYIYMVQNEEGGPVGVFTVKHECKTWLQKVYGLYEHGFVSRWEDGTGRYINTVPVKDFLSLNMKEKRSFVDGSDAGGERE